MSKVPPNDMQWTGNEWFGKEKSVVFFHCLAHLDRIELWIQTFCKYKLCKYKRVSIFNLKHSLNTEQRQMIGWDRTEFAIIIIENFYELIHSVAYH